jgi:hypothetical protein
MRVSDKRCNAAQVLNRAAAIGRTRTSGRVWPPARLKRCVLSQHNRAARALLAAKIAAVKWVDISDLWL